MRVTTGLFVLLGLLGLSACDGVSDNVTVSTGDKKTPTPTTPVTPVVPKETTTRDTTLLPGDTTQRVVTSRWLGDSLVSRDTQTVAVTEFIWLVNRYGEPVLMEAWTGDSLAWRNGYVLGNNLNALPDAKASVEPLADGARRRLGARPRGEIMVVAGVPNGSGAVFLAAMRYRKVVAGDTLLLDEQGLLTLR